MVVRFIGSVTIHRFTTGRVLGTAAATACLLVVVSMLSFGHVVGWYTGDICTLGTN
jgi:fucose permease